MINRYKPNYVSPPGETLLETLNTLKMTQADLATRTGRSVKTINEIIKGKAPITPETALQFELVLNTPATFWNNREKNYREFLARKAAEIQLKSQISWLKKFPIGKMVDYGWLPAKQTEIEKVKSLLSFFGIGHPLHWGRIYKSLQVTCRKIYSGNTNFNSLTAWLRVGELSAHQVKCQPFNHKKFLEALKIIRTFTVKKVEEFFPEMQRLCSDAGVAVIFVRELPKLSVCGTTRWLSPEKAMIQLSLIYKTNDQVWFTFFHEAGHVVLHGKRDIFIDGNNLENKKEDEADTFAEDILIPQKEFDNFVQKGDFTDKNSILQFAFTQGIAPAIVLGRLQHFKKLPYGSFDDLKVRFEWTKQCNTE
jgi:addiction module HigA family antidote